MQSSSEMKAALRRSSRPPLTPPSTTPPPHSSECGQEGAGCCACVKCLLHVSETEMDNAEAEPAGAAVLINVETCRCS